MNSSAAAMRPLASDLADGSTTLPSWQTKMRESIKAEFTRQYFLGIGGRDQMTASNWGSLGGMLAKQYKFLDQFAIQIAAGELSEKQIGARAEMYILAARAAFERATANARGLVLPQYPGDGNQVCLSRCACNWVHKRRKGKWHSTWTLGIVDHCETCLSNADKWNPLINEIKGA